MFTRQKYLLAYVQACEGKCSRLQLDKGLFWFCKNNPILSLYDFHPYSFGPFSETLYLDLRVLQDKEILFQSEENIELRIPKDQGEKLVSGINENDKTTLKAIANDFSHLSFDQLLQKVYSAYPYYAINNPSFRNQYEIYDPRTFPKNQGAKIFSIGYEGVSIDEFINKLIQNNVQSLVDVRNNPRSMKFGFSEKKLKGICERHNIEYLSIRSLGIESEKRQELDTQDDYRKLFVDFEKNHMPNVKEELHKLRRMLEEGKRLALMCFEKDIHCCHREVVTRHLCQLCKGMYELQHI